MDKFGDHRHCDMGDLIIFICHVISCATYLKCRVTLWMEGLYSKLPLVMFGIHWSNASGDITYLICHMI